MADARGLSAAVFQTEPIRDFSKDVAVGMQVKAEKRKLKKEEVEAFDEKYGITYPEGVSSSFMPIMNQGIDQYKSARNEYIQAKERKSSDAPMLKQKLDIAKENLNKLTEVAKAGQVNSDRVYKLSQDQKDSLSREKLQENNEYIERMNTPEGQVDLLNGTINGKPMPEFVNPPALPVNKTETNPLESVYTKTIGINKDIYTSTNPDTEAETFNELKAQQIAADRLTNRSPEGVDMVVDYLAKENGKTRDDVTQEEIDVAFKNEDTMKAIQDDYVDYARMMTSEKAGTTTQEGGKTVTRENIGDESKTLGRKMKEDEVYGPFLGNDKEKIPGPFSENDVVKNNVIIGMVPTQDIIITRNSTFKNGEETKNEALDHKVLDIKYNKTKGEYYAKLVANEESGRNKVLKTEYPNDKLTETQVLSIENQMGLSPEVELKDVIESLSGDEQPTNTPETESNTESPDKKQNKETNTAPKPPKNEEGQVKEVEFSPSGKIVETTIEDYYGNRVKVDNSIKDKLEQVNKSLSDIGGLKIADSHVPTDIKIKARKKWEKDSASFEKNGYWVNDKGQRVKSKPPKQAGKKSFHTKGLAIDLNQEDPNMKSERVFKELRAKGFKQHPDEWWHWSVGEFKHEHDTSKKKPKEETEKENKDTEEEINLSEEEQQALDFYNENKDTQGINVEKLLEDYPKLKELL